MKNSGKDFLKAVKNMPIQKWTPEQKNKLEKLVSEVDQIKIAIKEKEGNLDPNIAKLVSQLCENFGMGDYYVFLHAVEANVEAYGIHETSETLNELILEKNTLNTNELEKYLNLSTPHGFRLLAQSHATNKLQKTLTKRLNNKTQLDLNGNGSIIEADFKLFIKGYDELLSGVKQSAAMLLDSLMIKATETGLKDTLVTLPLNEYMAMRELKDEKETRRQVKEDLAAIERVSFEYRGTGKNKGAWLKVHISGGTTGQVKNGDIIFRFNQEFYDSFKAEEGNRYLYMYFPREALQGNIKYNPWKYWLARKISEHKRMNIGKSNENVISVKTLIDACPNFPEYKEIMEGARQISKRIIEPFERDFNALNPTITWEYQNLKESPGNYTDFIGANIVVHWATYPALPQIEAGKRKRAAKQQASKKKLENDKQSKPQLSE